METQALYTALSIFALILGLIVGSFLNVCVYRIPKGESVVRPRSRCPKCGNAIAAYDNLPVISWLILGAKCRHCGLAISWQYPLVEAITGTLFFLVFWRFGLTVATPIYMLLSAGLVLVTFVDLTDWTIPDEVSIPGIFVGLGCSVVAQFYPASGLHVLGPDSIGPVFNSLIGIVVGGAIPYVLDKLTLLLLKKPGMGLGDVKLLAMLGAFFGWPGALLIVVLASCVGSVIGITLVLVQKYRGAEKSDHYLPFGPYLSLAGLIVMFIGSNIYSAYLNYMSLPV